ncbi:hypothetical protein NQ318_019358 [Aromia moschata]|uniref:Uncharacterized protein n=1 Tax=Aromia moschata TaxID=1265417 RepID=A0AAV8Y124_9CUCU|nr:hypothetical protein NQ318_019358 [Aromia moschata]
MSECSLPGTTTNADPCLNKNLMAHKKPVTEISFNPDNKQFASSSEDHSIMVWNVNQNVRSYNCVGHTDIVTSVEYSSDGKLLASASKDQTVRFWVPSIRGGSTNFKAHTSSVNCVCFSPDNTKMITGSNDKSIKMWDVSRRHFLTSLLGHNHWVRCVRYSPEGDMILSCSDDRTVRVWDTNTGQCLHVFTSVNGSPNYLAIHRNNNSIAVAMNTGSVRVYDIRNKKLQQHYALHDNSTCVSWHPQANYLLTAGKDGKLRIVDVMEGRPLYTLTGHKGAVNTCKFSVNGDFFASGGADQSVSFWKTNFIDDD